MIPGPLCLRTSGETNHNRHAEERAAVHLMVVTKKANREERIWGANIPSKGTPQWLNFFPEGFLSQNLHYLPKVQRTKSLTHVLGGDPNHSSMVLAGHLTGTQLCARRDEGNANRFFPLQSYSLLEKSYMKRSTGSGNGEHSYGNPNERTELGRT